MHKVTATPLKKITIESCCEALNIHEHVRKYTKCLPLSTRLSILLASQQTTLKPVLRTSAFPPDVCLSELFRATENIAQIKSLIAQRVAKPGPKTFGETTQDEKTKILTQNTPAAFTSAAEIGFHTECHPATFDATPSVLHGATASPCKRLELYVAASKQNDSQKAAAAAARVPLLRAEVDEGDHRSVTELRRLLAQLERSKTKRPDRIPLPQIASRPLAAMTLLQKISVFCVRLGLQNPEDNAPFQIGRHLSDYLRAFSLQGFVPERENPQSPESPFANKTEELIFQRRAALRFALQAACPVVFVPKREKFLAYENKPERILAAAKLLRQHFQACGGCARRHQCPHVNKSIETSRKGSLAEVGTLIGGLYDTARLYMRFSDFGFPYNPSEVLAYLSLISFIQDHCNDHPELLSPSAVLRATEAHRVQEQNARKRRETLLNEKYERELGLPAWLRTSVDLKSGLKKQNSFERYKKKQSEQAHLYAEEEESAGDELGASHKNGLDRRPEHSDDDPDSSTVDKSKPRHNGGGNEEMVWIEDPADQDNNSDIVGTLLHNSSLQVLGCRQEVPKMVVLDPIDIDDDDSEVISESDKRQASSGAKFDAAVSIHNREILAWEKKNDQVTVGPVPVGATPNQTGNFKKPRPRFEYLTLNDRAKLTQSPASLSQQQAIYYEYLKQVWFPNSESQNLARIYFFPSKKLLNQIGDKGGQFLRRQLETPSEPPKNELAEKSDKPILAETISTTREEIGNHPTVMGHYGNVRAEWRSKRRRGLLRKKEALIERGKEALENGTLPRFPLDDMHKVAPKPLTGRRLAAMLVTAEAIEEAQKEAGSIFRESSRHRSNHDNRENRENRAFELWRNLQ